jgi:hypothetical protein
MHPTDKGKKVLEPAHRGNISPGEKCESKNGMVEILSFSFWQAFCSSWDI